MMKRTFAKTSFSSPGERIYFTGISASDAPITYTGGGVHLQMMGGGCAACHGADRRGARLMPEFWAEAPALTRDALLGKHRDGDEHADHAVYDVASLRRAIARGLDASGRAMDPLMPRWSMADEDWQHLLEYLLQ